MKQHNHSAAAFSLVELVAVVAMLGVLATIIIRRVDGHHDTGKTAACHVYQGDIGIQVELWRHNTGTLPASNLATIGTDINYFPGGLPTCPVDGSSYTIDTVTGLVVGHNH
ncbi:MAG: hypothetical protein GXP28_09060 [Planctomycetes bacterium]|nr:hypothetical protein [Planctomycetota bacterium]